jgi:hypothetical protein
MCLCELKGRHADLALERSSQVPLTDAEVSSELSDGAVVERTGGNAVRCHACETGHGVHQRTARRELRPAAKTGSETRALGGSG